MAEQFDYERLMNLCAQLEAGATPAMVHGTLSGHLCAGARFTAEQFIGQVLEIMESSKDPEAEHKVELIAFYDTTLSVLQDEQMLFMPLIAPASQPMAQRMMALASWCAAFISGFGLSGRDLTHMSADAEEIMGDLAEVALLQAEDADDSEEEDWITVFEHVRLSAVSLFLEFNESPNSEKPDTTTH